MSGVKSRCKIMNSPPPKYYLLQMEMERPRREDGQQMDNKLAMWDPREARRNMGRQRTRWADQLKRFAGDQKCKRQSVVGRT